MSLTIAYVHGTAPDKWFRRFVEQTQHSIEKTFGCDDPIEPLLEGEADVALVRLPHPGVGEAHHVVRLYEEQPGIGLPKEHELTLLQEISADDIAEETCLYRAETCVDVAQVRDAIQVVAANVGVVLAPQPLLRSINNKAVEHRPYISGEPTTIAVVWNKDADCEEIQDFVGITRGRKAQSSRTAMPKRTAREKAIEKQKRRAKSIKQQAKRDAARRRRR